MDKTLGMYWIEQCISRTRAQGGADAAEEAEAELAALSTEQEPVETAPSLSMGQAMVVMCTCGHSRYEHSGLAKGSGTTSCDSFRCECSLFTTQPSTEEDLNEYRPWESEGIDELEYYKNLCLRLSAELGEPVAWEVEYYDTDVGIKRHCWSLEHTERNAEDHRAHHDVIAIRPLSYTAPAQSERRVEQRGFVAGEVLRDKSDGKPRWSKDERVAQSESPQDGELPQFEGNCSCKPAKHIRGCTECGGYKTLYDAAHPDVLARPQDTALGYLVRLRNDPVGDGGHWTWFANVSDLPDIYETVAVSRTALREAQPGGEG